jgi:hypothetical protein
MAENAKRGGRAVPTHDEPDPNAPTETVQGQPTEQVRYPTAESPTYTTVTTPTTDTAGELEYLRAENGRLKRQLGLPDEVSQAPGAPSFGMSEGVRKELEMRGQATDPNTGRTVKADETSETDQPKA